MEEIRNQNAKVLIDELGRAYEESIRAVKTRKFEVSEATSFLSAIYERIRNTIDFKDEHLIRRFAIQRFLRFSLTSRSNPDEVADLLIRDLIRGAYEDDTKISDSKVEEISKVLEKYAYSKQVLNELRIPELSKTWDWLLGVAASEIEKILDPLYKPEIFVKLLSQYILNVLRDSKLDLSSEQESLHVFIASHKALVKSDYSILRYHAMTFLYPSFFQDPGHEIIKSVVTALPSTKAYVDSILKSKVQESLYMQIRKVSAPIKVLEGVLEENPDRLELILTNPNFLRDKSEDYIKKYYSELKRKLTLRITRTLGYLFITKMLLAILIEAPVDLIFMKRINYFTLTINTAFPVVLFYLIAKRITIPGRENNDRIHQVLKSIVYEDRMFLSDQEEKSFRKKILVPGAEKPWMGLIYAVLYLLVYGVIFLILSNLGFNFTSIVIFIFFVSILSYFAWNIRARCQDLEIIPKKDNLGQAVLNIIALPILKVGQSLSMGVARFNFFTLIFDFILEAPFRLIIQSFEDLIDFLKSKHEEVVQG
ncbi:hypothetical protein A2716_01240 [candidate division WWE3 bacterium RIFCSPHIGHO2_01_FULL_40_23]|uniref:Uncharacterized protein n=1 Tax=candidate division WWE3 bacterium RIFCSPLOWO2_01_FULL_41_18 TaxID=1802625 RepID=A0A1F4VDN7_UNCKA|nr:MAG: hypothetical protein A2716_01240 [candidate division WWE3 bacterium RIFCSPHIGHO2_01_FULL_40_23]OGC55361.1 MAG: hypothetical protein A3A78_00145 [candidate division WWE3 bacterium RIFCSPLOWO2_01_FULL_41_18]